MSKSIKGTYFTVLTMIITMAVISVITAFCSYGYGEYTYGDYTYTVSGNEATIVYVDRDITGKVNVPSKIGEYKVVAIGDNAFEECLTITAVTIPDTVTYIGYNAFFGCKSIGELVIGNSVDIIEAYAFGSCSGIKSVIIPDSVSYMGEGSFSGCSRMTSIFIGKGIKEIPRNMCQNSNNLATVYMGENVVTVKNSAFYECTSLENVIWGTKLEVIESHSFSETNIKYLTIPSTVKSIGNCAFSRSKIEVLNIGENVESIGHSAFEGALIRNLYIPDKVVSLGEFAFQSNQELQSLEIGDGLKDIPNYCFMGCEKLISVKIGDNVENINYSSFNGCSSLTYIDFGNSVKKIGENAFRDCVSLKELSLPNTITGIGDHAFMDCKVLKKVSFGGNTVNVGTWSFAYCENLEEVVFYGIINIGSSAFHFCNSLKTLYIPDTLQSIDAYFEVHDIYYGGSRSDWEYVLGREKVTATNFHYNYRIPDLTSPAGFIDSTNKLSANQTVTLDLSDNVGVAGYYWGTKPDYQRNNYTETSEENVTEIIDKAATFYLTVKDTSGNISDTYSITYRKLRFMPNSGQLPQEIENTDIIVIDSQPVELPVATKDNAVFRGWSTDAAAKEGVMFLAPAANGTYYAIWEQLPSANMLSYIEINTLPYIRNIRIYGQFESMGLSIIAYYDNNSAYELTSGFTLSGVDTSKEGKQTVRITFGDKYAEFDIVVYIPRIFDDVSTTAWYAGQIVYCYDKGYINGMTKSTFAPNGTLSRAQFVTILAQVDGVDLDEYISQSSGFTDVKSSHWYHKAVTWAAKKGYVSGMGNGIFGPNQNITREQLARLFFNYASNNGVDVSGRADLSGFTDQHKISSWAYKEVQWAVDVGLISGMNPTTIAPTSTATRAQAATIFMKFDKIK